MLDRVKTYRQSIAGYCRLLATAGQLHATAGYCRPAAAGMDSVQTIAGWVEGDAFNV